MKSPISSSRTRQSSWWRLLAYFLKWFGCCVVAFIPVLIINQFVFDWDFRNRPPYPNVINLTTNLGMLVGTIWVTYITVRGEKRKLSSLFIIPLWKDFLKGFGFGTMFMIVFMIITQSFGIIRFELADFSKQFYFDFFFFLMIAVIEEIVSRGHILSILKEKYSDFISLLVSSVIFGLFHLGNDHVTVIGLSTITASGSLMGLITLRTGSISMAVGLHWAWNFVQGAILGLCVSGQDQVGIFAPQFLSSALLTGGDFGAEGSLIMLVITILVLILVYRFWLKIFGVRLKDQSDNAQV